MPVDVALRPDLLSPTVPTFMVGVLAIVALAAWVAVHRVWKKLQPEVPGRGPAWAAFAVRVAVGTGVLWLICQFASRFIVLETNWRLVTCGFIGGLATEILLTLFAWEKRLVSPRVGRVLLGLRLAALAAVLAILLQPVLAWMQKRKIERRVVVMIDDSGSMQLDDRQMSATEKLDLADFSGVTLSTPRPALSAVREALREFREALAREAEVWKPVEGLDEAAEKSFVEKHRAALTALADQGKKLASTAEPVLNAVRQDEGKLGDDGRRALNDLQTRLRDTLPDGLKNAVERAGENRIQPVTERLSKVTDLARESAEALPVLGESADQALMARLSDSDRRLVDTAALVPRSKIAHDVLTKPLAGAKPLLDELAAKYDVSVIRFGRTSAEFPDANFPDIAKDSDFRLRTDVTGALDDVLKKVPAESLAGVLLLTDGRHNVEERPIDDTARSLGLNGSPIHCVGIGSTRGPKDAALLKVESPESIYLGDKIKVKADLKADGYKGRQMKVTLTRDGQAVDTQVVPVPEDNHRTSVRLGYTPPDKGIFSYAVKIEPLEGELFADNNTWEFETAVTEDRTNVLLVDGTPRWEFRYLRNLFYGRDKSVHLQYVVLSPDTIEGQDPLPAVAASATRKFGEAEATRLPANSDEWRRFDVIIVGDVPPGVFGTETWQTIEKCVSERGAMLVCIAGPKAMPHGFSSETVKRLLPIEYGTQTGPIFAGPEPSFVLKLTSEGKNSPIMAQSPSLLESTRIWSELPNFMWRHPIKAVKAGAEVLAYAETGAARTGTNAGTAEERLNAFARQREREAQYSLLVTSRYGLGKVVMLNFDQTWRLRYGVGDVYHHRFWGNLLRWGTGENLRAGTDRVRLGTDRLTYETGEPVKILAKLTRDGFAPATDADVTATITAPDGQSLGRRTLKYREGSSGLYEVDIDPSALTQVGKYQLTLGGGDVDKLLRGGAVGKVETHFTVRPTSIPVEFGDLSQDREWLAKTATLSNGSVVAPAAAGRLANAFGAESKSVEERKETTLWDNWILLTAALAALTAEWIVRRKVGIA